MWLICGLGNPGLEYQNTWHNAGFTVVDAIVEEQTINLAKKFNAYIGNFMCKSQKVYLTKTLTYMNLTGPELKRVAQYFSIQPDRIIVVHDDIDLSLGKVKIKFGGGEGGHNGLRSITNAFKTQDYHRIRLGVGRGIKQGTGQSAGQEEAKLGTKAAASYVLSQIKASSRLEFDQLVQTGVETVYQILQTS